MNEKIWLKIQRWRIWKVRIKQVSARTLANNYFRDAEGKKDLGKEIEEKYSETEKEPGQYNIPKVRGHLGSTTLMLPDTHLEYHFPCNLIQIELASSSIHFSYWRLSPAQIALCCPLLIFSCYNSCQLQVIVNLGHLSVRGWQLILIITIRGLLSTLCPLGYRILFMHVSHLWLCQSFLFQVVPILVTNSFLAQGKHDWSLEWYEQSNGKLDSQYKMKLV